MSLRYALLGLLTDRSASGYDLSRAFDRGLGRYAWHAQHNQIYQELNRLAADGLTEVVEEGARGRKTYAITDAGRADLLDWLRRRPARAVVRNEWMLRLFLMSALDPEETRQILVDFADQMDRELAELTTLLATDTEFSDHPQSFGTIAAHFGQRMYPAMRDWARDEVGRIDRSRPPG